MKALYRGWVLLLLSILPASIEAHGTAFSYQGHLVDGGRPANGSYDFELALMDATVGGNRVGALLTNAPVEVSNGLFSLLLDFGDGMFDGLARWLQIGCEQIATLARSWCSARARQLRQRHTPYLPIRQRPRRSPQAWSRER